MNSQVVPSMVLSVLIVCFFAVVLFPMERDHEQAVKANAAPKAVGPLVAPATPPPPAAASSPPPAVATVSSAPQAAAPEPEGPDLAPKVVASESTTAAPEPIIAAAQPTPAAEPSLVAVQPPSEDVAAPRIEGGSNATPIPAASAQPADAPVREVLAAPSPPDEMPVAASTPVPSVPDHHAVAANPEPVATQPAQVDMPPEPPAVASKGEGNLRDPERADSPPTRREPVSIPRGDPEATIVEPGETLEDVAVRVYGGRGGIETLLRANREVLSRRKGPLRPGLQLWTPAR